MNDDQLQNLLRTADGEPPRALALSAETLLAAARRRRRQRAGVRSLAAVGLVLLVVAPFVARQSSNSQTPKLASVIVKAQPDAPLPLVAAPKDIRRELARLEHEARSLDRVISAVLASDPFDDAPQAERLDDANLVCLETARSAVLSLQYARIAERELHDLDAARREYQRIAQRFPHTPWSEYAVVSLQRLEQAAPDPSAL